MNKRKIPGYEDKVLDKEKLKKIKKEQTEIAAGRIKKTQGRIIQDGK